MRIKPAGFADAGIIRTHLCKRGSSVVPFRHHLFEYSRLRCGFFALCLALSCIRPGPFRRRLTICHRCRASAAVKGERARVGQAEEIQQELAEEAERKEGLQNPSLESWHYV